MLSRLPLPGATPDLLLLVVVGAGARLRARRRPGRGFGAGLAADLVPPADHAVGRWALVLSRHRLPRRAGARRAPALGVRAAGGRRGRRRAASVLLYAGLGALMDDPNVTWAAVRALLPTAVLYDVVLSAVRRPRRRSLACARPGRARPDVPVR